MTNTDVVGMTPVVMLFSFLQAHITFSRFEFVCGRRKLIFYSFLCYAFYVYVIAFYCTKEQECNANCNLHPG